MPILVAGTSTQANRSGQVVLLTQQPCIGASPTRQTCNRLVVLPGVEPAPANTFAIVNNTGTQVLHSGLGAYSVEKVSGAAGYNAGAVSSVGTSGDFVLRITKISTLSAVDAFNAGVNTDPLTDDSFASIDFSWLHFADSNTWTIYESGVGIVNLAANGYCWIWRIGSTLYYGRGATLAAAQASPDRSVASTGTVYFDSSLNTVGDKFEAQFYFVVAVYNDTLTESLTAADVATSVVAFPNALAESVAAAFSPVSAVTFPNAISEAATAGDSLVGGLLLTASLSESVAAGFAPVVAAAFNSTVAEPVTATFSPVGAAIFASPLSESLTAAASQSGAATFASSLTETVAAVATQTVAAIFANALTESVAAADSDGAVATFSNVLSESAVSGVVLVDQLTSGATYNEFVSENLVASVSYTFAGEVKAFDGVDWRAHPARAWNGSRWAIKPVKFWSGSGWTLG